MHDIINMDMDPTDATPNIVTRIKSIWLLAPDTKYKPTYIVTIDDVTINMAIDITNIHIDMMTHIFFLFWLSFV